MKLYEVTLSFESADGNSTAVFTSLRKATKYAIEWLKDERANDIENIEKYQSDYDPGDLDATIDLVTTRPITAQRLCDIINSRGGSFVASRTPLLKVALASKANQPVMETRLQESEGVKL